MTDIVELKEVSQVCSQTHRMWSDRRSVCATVKRGRRGWQHYHQSAKTRWIGWNSSLGCEVHSVHI